jgi:hypothetical protein
VKRARYGVVVEVGVQIAVVQIAAAPADELNAAGV